MAVSWTIEQHAGTGEWSWSESMADGGVARKSASGFKLFMDAFDDARVNGCTGMPRFLFPGESI